MTGGDSVKMSFRSWMHIPEKKVKISGILFKKKKQRENKIQIKHFGSWKRAAKIERARGT